MNFEQIYRTVQVCAYGKGSNLFLNISAECYTAVLYLNLNFALIN